MQKREIPIYKICHIRSPNDYKDILSERLQQLAPSETGAPGSAPVPVEEPGQEIQVEAGSSASGIKVPQSQPSLTISDNTLYVFFGEVEYDITEDDETRTINVNEHFKIDPKHEIFENIFSKYELNSIKETNINVVFLPERIYPDDSIETIKKKLLIHTRLSLRLTYGDLYMFCKQVKNLKSNHINDQLTSNGKMEITPIRIQNFLLNIDNHPREVVDYGGADLSEDVARQYTDFTKLGDPSPETGNYGYSNILNLKLEDAPRFMNVVMGQELSSVSHDYPYSVNPFDAVYMDPFLESHISEIINTTNKKALQGDKIETPSYITENNLKIDYSFYITNQIMKPVQQVFALVLEKMWTMQNKTPKIIKFKRDVEALRKTVEHDKFDDKLEQLKNKEVKALLFDEYLRETNNEKAGNQSITKFFK